MHIWAPKNHFLTDFMHIWAPKRQSSLVDTLDTQKAIKPGGHPGHPCTRACTPLDTPVHGHVHPWTPMEARQAPMEARQAPHGGTAAPKRAIYHQNGYLHQNGLFTTQNGLFTTQNGLFYPPWTTKMGYFTLPGPLKWAILTTKWAILPPKMGYFDHKMGYFTPKTGYFDPSEGWNTRAHAHAGWLGCIIYGVRCMPVGTLHRASTWRPVYTRTTAANHQQKSAHQA